MPAMTDAVAAKVARLGVPPAAEIRALRAVARDWMETTPASPALVKYFVAHKWAYRFKHPMVYDGITDREMDKGEETLEELCFWSDNMAKTLTGEMTKSNKKDRGKRGGGGGGARQRQAELDAQQKLYRDYRKQQRQREKKAK